MKPFAELKGMDFHFWAHVKAISEGVIFPKA